MNKCSECGNQCSIDENFQCPNCGEQFWRSKELFEKRKKLKHPIYSQETISPVVRKSETKLIYRAVYSFGFLIIVSAIFNYSLSFGNQNCKEFVFDCILIYIYKWLPTIVFYYVGYKTYKYILNGEELAGRRWQLRMLFIAILLASVISGVILTERWLMRTLISG